MIRIYFSKLKNNNLEITENMLNDILSYMKRQDKEIERLKERLDIAQTAYLSLDEKINKAIEYIEENCSEHGNEESMWFYRTINADNVINILKGVDKKW